MRRRLAVLAFLTVCSIAVVGCGSGGSTGDGVPSDVQNQLSQAADLAKKVDGNYDKLTADEKQVFLKMTNNNEKDARERIKLMAHPPNEKYLKKS